MGALLSEAVLKALLWCHTESCIAADTVVHYLMIQRTSAVTTTVLGEINIIGLLLLSSILLGVCPCDAFRCANWELGPS